MNQILIIRLCLRATLLERDHQMEMQTFVNNQFLIIVLYQIK